MLVKSPDEIEQVLREAEHIKAGENPATVTTETAEAGPATSAGAQDGAAVTPAAAPSPSFDQLAGLAVMLCDWPFVRMFGAQGQLPDPFRIEAQKAWAEILEKYLPAAVAKTGPFGVLLSLYSMHGAGLYLQWQMSAVASESSENAAQGNQPS